MQVNKCERGGSVHLICMLEVDYLYDSSILFDIPQQIYLGKARTFEIIHERQIVSKYILQAKMGKSNNCPWGPNWWTININFKNLPNVHFSKTKFRNPSLFKLNCPQRLSQQGKAFFKVGREGGRAFFKLDVEYIYAVLFQIGENSEVW